MSVRNTNRDEFLPAGDEFAEGDAFSLIDRNSSFDGVFKSDRDVRIEGEAKGTVECQGTLFVAEGGVVTATVLAENVTVAGELTGEVRCRGRLQVMPSGRLRGKVATRTLVVNEGAIYEGQLEMAAIDEPARQGRPTSIAPVPIAAASEGRGAGGNGGNATTFIRRMGGPETPWDAGNEGAPTEGEAPPVDEREA
ncbi:MAG: polymer-forming cytoskeletal protein [Chloroflexia bacterium]|nr:polymer-forming cytoskeletal protein [Chloroflexia bacterium]